MLSINKIKNEINKNIKYQQVDNLFTVDIDLSNYKILDKKFLGFVYELNYHFLSFYKERNEKERKIIDKKIFNKDKINNLSIVYYKSPYSSYTPIYFTDKYLRDFSLESDSGLLEFISNLNNRYQYNFFVKNYSVRKEYKNNNSSLEGTLLFDFYKKHAEEEIYFIDELKELNIPISSFIYSDSSGMISNRDYYFENIKEEKAVIKSIKEKHDDLTYYVEAKSIEKIDESFIDDVHYNLISGIYYYFRDTNNYFDINEMNYSYKSKNIIINYLVSDNLNKEDHYNNLFNLLFNNIEYIYFPLIVKDYSQPVKFNDDISSMFIYKDDSLINNNLLSLIDIYNESLIQGQYISLFSNDIPCIGIINEKEISLIIDKRNIKKDISIKVNDKTYLLSCWAENYIFIKFNI